MLKLADNSQWLINILEDNSTNFTFREYQRPYSWEKKQIDEFLDAITSIINYNKESNYMGTIELRENDKNTCDFKEIFVVDGQQRLCTFTLILKALESHLSLIKNPNEDIKETIDSIHNLLKNKITRKNKEYITNENKYKIILLKKDKVFYDNIMENKADLKEKNFIYNAYNHIYKFFLNSNIDLLTFWDAMSKLKIYTKICKSAEEEIEVFIAVNTTGKPLTSWQKIRPHLIIDESRKQNDKLVNLLYSFEDLLQENDIESLLFHFLILKKKKYIIKKNLYDEILEYKDKNNLVNEVILQQLLDFKELYLVLIGDKKSTYSNKVINKFLYYFKYTHFKFFVMYFLNNTYNEKFFTEEQLKTIFSYFDNFIVRKNICGQYSLSTKTVKPFINTIEAFDLIFEDNTNISDENIKIIIINNLLSCKDEINHFPSDSELLDGILHNDIYKNRDCKTLLERIEAQLNKNNKEEYSNTSIATIEHIFPQNSTLWEEEYGESECSLLKKHLHSLSNLTLTQQNSTLSNKTFLEKKSILLKSKYSINSDFLCKLSEWNEPNILKHAEFYFNLILQMIPYPLETNKRVDLKVGESYNFDTSLNFNSTKPEKFTYLTYEEPVKNWSDCLLKIYNYIYSKYPVEFVKLLNNPDFSNILLENEIKKSYKIDTGIYLKYQDHAIRVIKVINKLLTYFGLQNDFYVILKNVSET